MLVTKLGENECGLVSTLHGLLKHTEDAATIPLKTKMAIAISKVVGIDNTVNRFDEIQVKLKSQKLKRLNLTRQQSEGFSIITRFLPMYA